MKKNKSLTICLILLSVCLIICVVLLCLLSRGNKESAENFESKDLTYGITANPVDTKSVELNGSQAVKITDFAVNLFRECAKSDDNVLISPVSVLYALAMTANGARNETLLQMENVLGGPTDDLNPYLNAYMKALPQSSYYKLNIANAVWFTEADRFTVNTDFLQTNADYYGAGIFQAPFDKSTLRDINNWVKEKTDNMIKDDILDDIPQEAVMYVVNALTFDAEWQKIYMDAQVRDDVFTTEDGKKQHAEFMYSAENVYLEDEKVTGFIKDYKNLKYSFVALLPKEGITVQDYIESMSGERLHALLSEPQYYSVDAAMPKFESDYDVEMRRILTDMGMADAFDVAKADFSGLGTSCAGNIYIDRVLHKTSITVDERGTKAGAATVVELVDCALPKERKEVCLNRPFIYMIIDREAKLPLFIGTEMEIQ